MAIIQFLNRNLIKDDHPIQLIFKESQTFELPKGYKFADICAVGGGAAGCPIMNSYHYNGTSTGPGYMVTRPGDHGYGGYVNNLINVNVENIGPLSFKIGTGGVATTNNRLVTPYSLPSGFYNIDYIGPRPLWWIANPTRKFINGGTASYIRNSLNQLVCYASGAGGWSKPNPEPTQSFEWYGAAGLTFSRFQQLGFGYFGSGSILMPIYDVQQIYNSGRKYMSYDGTHVYFYKPGFPIIGYEDTGFVDGTNEQVYGCTKWLFNQPDTILFGNRGSQYYKSAEAYTGDGGGSSLIYRRNKNSSQYGPMEPRGEECLLNTLDQLGVIALPGNGGSGIIYMRLWNSAKNHNPAVYNPFYWKINTYLVQNGQLIPIEWDYNYR